MVFDELILVIDTMRRGIDRLDFTSHETRIQKDHHPRR